MKRRETLQKALTHKDGPVPMDFGGTAVTGIHVSVVAALRDHYGLEKRPVKVIEPYQMLGDVEDDLKDAMGVDTTGIFGRSTLFGFASNSGRNGELLGVSPCWCQVSSTSP